MKKYFIIVLCGFSLLCVSCNSCHSESESDRMELEIVHEEMAIDEEFDDILDKITEYKRTNDEVEFPYYLEEVNAKYSKYWGYKLCTSYSIDEIKSAIDLARVKKKKEKLSSY